MRPGTRRYIAWTVIFTEFEGYVWQLLEVRETRKEVDWMAEAFRPTLSMQQIFYV
jgi:hypothetical protein